MSLALITKNQLHNLADAASLAGTRVLGKKYAAMPTYAGYTLTAQDIKDITDAVTQVAANNIAGGKSPITIDGGDIRRGRWDSSTRTLTVTDTEATAVEVTARRDTIANGPISTFFANVMGINALSVTSVSERQGGMWTGQENPTAALTGVGEVGPKELVAPIGISQLSVQSNGFCGSAITLNDTKTSCAGWTSFFDSNTSANTMTDMMQKMQTNSYPTPEAKVGDTFYYSGGTQGSTFQAFAALFAVKKDPITGVWEIFVPVYKEGGTTCANPSTPIEIVGFASIKITNVIPTGNKAIVGDIECDLVHKNTRGGGANYGTLGEIPGLVK